jgi:hypothetical protein
MNKKTVTVFNKKNYLLGTDKDGKNYYLVMPSWDCGWYWGFGYVTSYTNNKRPDLARDISSHLHFDSLFFNQKQHAFDSFKEFFVKSPLSDDEIWQLCDYMKTFYTLRESAEVFGRGYSHYTEMAKLETLKNDDMLKMINEIMLPVLFEKIENTLSGKRHE